MKRTSSSSSLFALLQRATPLLLGLLFGRLLFGGDPTAGRKSGRLSAAVLTDEQPSPLPAASRAEWRARVDEEPIHIFHAICGTSIPAHDMDWHGLTIVKTILMARATGASKNRRYHFHIATDPHFMRMLSNPIRTDFADVMEYAMNRTDGRVKISFYDVEKDIQAPTASAVGTDAAALVDNKLFKQCSTIRMKLPFIGGPLASVDRLLYIDFDSIVKCDLETMWEEELGNDWTEQQIFSFSEEGPHPMYPTSYSNYPADPKTYRKFPSAYLTGFNAGIFAMRLDRWRAVKQQYWAEVADIVKKEGYKEFNMTVDGKTGLTYGDQVRAFAMPAAACVLIFAVVAGAAAVQGERSIIRPHSLLPAFHLFAITHTYVGHSEHYLLPPPGVVSRAASAV